MSKEESNKLGHAFEKKFGGVELLKAAFSSFCRLMVDKGVCTEDEIQTYFIKEVEERLQKIKEGRQ